jgi:hypothetical protein
MFIPPVAIIRKKRIIKRLWNAGAVSAETAKTLDEVGIFRGVGLIISRLEVQGSLVNLGNEKYYVNVNKC